MTPISDAQSTRTACPVLSHSHTVTRMPSSPSSTGHEHPPYHQLEDDAVRSAVLLHLLAEHPAQLTVDELLLEIAGARPDFAEADQIHRAVRDLEHDGLLQRYDQFVIPTRPAVHFHRLAREW